MSMISASKVGWWSCQISSEAGGGGGGGGV